MKRNASKVLAVAGALLSFTLATASAATYTFEGTVADENSFLNGSDVSGSYLIDGATFGNNYGTFPGGYYWSGFGFSNTTDVSTPGLPNQYSSYAGSGAGGSATYAVSSVFDTSTISFGSDVDVVGASFTNTTYAALVILNGDLDFGTEAFTEGDWFKLTVTGYLDNESTSSVEFYLADYRDGALIVQGWEYVDLSSLGTVDQLQFALTSSDVGPFGMNTPAYFAMDNLTVVPEPGTLVLAFVGGLGLLTRRRR